MLAAPTVKGDVKNPAQMLSLDDTEKYLRSSIDSEEFIIYFQQPDGRVGQSVIMQACVAAGIVCQLISSSGCCC